MSRSRPVAVSSGSALADPLEIYHLACPASPPHYQYNAVKTIKTSFMGTLNMLGLAKRTKARFLITSTSEVYGDPEEHPQREDYWGHVNCIGPRACYDEGKRVAETLTYGYMRQDGVDVRVARIFNTFGPRMNPYDGRVVSNFIIQALKGEDMTVYGDGSQTRSFQYIHDLVDGLILLMNGPETRPVNIGNGDEFTILEFAEAVRVSPCVSHTSLLEPNADISPRTLSRRSRRRRATRSPSESTSSTRRSPPTTPSDEGPTPPEPRRPSSGSLSGRSGRV